MKNTQKTKHLSFTHTIPIIFRQLTQSRLVLYVTVGSDETLHPISFKGPGLDEVQ